MTSSIKTLYAYDGSGSTGNSRLYHETSQSIFRSLPTDSSTQILFWDSSARVISPHELRTINQSMKGRGGTDPVAVAHHIIATNFHGNLVFLSDGQVYAHQIDFCDRTLPSGWTFESVRVILVETGITGSVNMSVSCPFTRNSPHTVQMVTARNPTPTTVTQVTPDIIALLADLDKIKTVADWTAAAPLLEPAVIARTMGTTGDPSLRDRLLALKKRIQRAEADAKGGSLTTVALYDALASGNTNAALTLASVLTREYYGEEDDSDTRSWSSQINRLVSMCEGALRGTFDLSNVNGAIHSDRARRAPIATPIEATTAELSEPDLSVASDTMGASFVCPITLDATGDSDVALLITEGEPLLTGIDKDIVNSLTNCPLYIFRYPELLARFQARLDHPLSLRALKDAEAVGASITESPMTRNPILGAICLGPYDDHSAATTWTLARLTAGGKCLGNPDLWFAVIWLLVQRDAVPYLRPILPQLTAHLMWRLHTHKAPLSLLGTPEFPTTRVPLAVSIWYAVASSAMTPQPLTVRETVRAHLPYLEELLTIQRQTGFPLPGALALYLKRLRVTMAALAWSKRDEAGLRGALRALTQRALQIEGHWVFLDGSANVDQRELVLASLPPIFQELTEAELVGIGRLVDPSKSAADVAFPYNWTPSLLPEATSKWPYGLAPIPRFPIPVCPATCRPYFKVPPTKTHTWEDEARAIFHMEPNQFLPVHAEFGNYVVKYGVFPTASEMLLYLWRRVVAQGRKTLPSQVEGFIEDILRDFTEVMTTLTPAEVALRFQASVKRVDRVRMEATI